MKMSRPREPFTNDDDLLLMKYIAKYAPAPDGRMGNNLYKHLVENASKKWPWSGRHTWQSWRERYKKDEEWFNAKIRRYQREHAIKVPERNKPVIVQATPSSAKVKPAVVHENSRDDRNKETAEKRQRHAGAARKTVQNDNEEHVNRKVEVGEKRKVTSDMEEVGGRKDVKRRRAENGTRQPVQVIVDEGQGTAVKGDGHCVAAPDSELQEEDIIDWHEVAVQATSSPPRDKGNKIVDEKLINTLKSLGKYITKDVLKEAIRWNDLDDEIERKILAESQQRPHDDETDIGSHETKNNIEVVVSDDLAHSGNSSRVSSPELSSARQDDVSEPNSGEENDLRYEQMRLNEAVVKSSAQAISSKANGIDKKRQNDEDYFASDLESIVSTHEASRLEGSTAASQASQTGSPKIGRAREPPRLANGAFKAQYAPGTSFKRIPDLDSDSDSESVEANVPATSKEVSSNTWPPSRQRKSSQKHTTGKPLPATVKVDKALTPNAPRSLQNNSGELLRPKEGQDGSHQLARRSGSDLSAQGIMENATSAPGPSRLPLVQEQRNVANNDSAWRENINIPTKDAGVFSPFTSVSSASPDPFAGAELGDHLSHSKVERRSRTRTDVNRRQTFGGFRGRQSLPSKDTDLRRRLARRSIASGLPGSNQRPTFTPEMTSGNKLQLSRRSSVASSVASTIELLADSEIPDVPILPTDGEMAMRIGFSHIFKVMASNYGVPEQWLRDTYKVLGSIHKTDEFGRVASIAAERGGEDEIGDVEDEAAMGDEEDEGMGATQDTPVPTKGLDSKMTPGSQMEQLHIRSSSGSRRKVELEIMPANEDSLPRIRDRYSPPRPSRAFNYVRLRKEGREEEAKERERRRATNSHSPNKRLETEPSHSSPVRPTSEHPDPKMNVSPNPPEGKSSAKPMSVFGGDGEAWTAEEDEIIRNADDADALREIDERRGRGSVSRRMVELMAMI